mmetsp:Transcript_7649/g.8406  ORF Transcript_7649/g.8406 Transcript_7649/m.8406 type:complete len:210 (+) Transcript_7649:1858-2487(+)
MKQNNLKIGMLSAYSIKSNTLVFSRMFVYVVLVTVTGHLTNVSLIVTKNCRPRHGDHGENGAALQWKVSRLFSLNLSLMQVNTNLAVPRSLFVTQNPCSTWKNVSNVTITNVPCSSKKLGDDGRLRKRLWNNVPRLLACCSVKKRGVESPSTLSLIPITCVTNQTFLYKEPWANTSRNHVFLLIKPLLSVDVADLREEISFSLQTLFTY